MIRFVSRLTASALLCTALPALAQEAPPVTTRPCELHVWPAEDFHTVYYGWGHGGTIDGGFKQRTGYARLWVDPLSMARQAQILAAQPLPARLGLGDYKLVDWAIQQMETPREQPLFLGVGFMVGTS